MTPASHVLVLAERRVIERAAHLAERIDAGDEAAWSAYLDTVRTLAEIAERLGHETAGRAMTSAELGERYGLSARTAARKAKAGQLPVSAIRLGQRGRAALRWKAAGA